MSTMRAPSTSLLRAFLKPIECTCQKRTATNFMPRHKFAKTTALDKLHRQQKAALRKERLDAELRAIKMPPPVLVSQSAETATEHSSTASFNTSPVASSLPYSISRTKSRHLPVYQTSKAGGNKHITQLRKLSGDLDALQTHIREALGLEESFIDRQGRKKENVTINRVTQQIIVRGWRGPEIKKWAEMVGF